MKVYFNRTYYIKYIIITALDFFNSFIYNCNSSKFFLLFGSNSSIICKNSDVLDPNSFLTEINAVLILSSFLLNLLISYNVMKSRKVRPNENTSHFSKLSIF